MSQTENTKNKGQKNVNQMLIRYGRLGQLGWFDHHESHISQLNPHVVIKTKRGLELGQIVGIHNYKGGHFKSSPEQVEQYYCNRTKDYPLGEGGTFVRYATHEDLREQEHLEKNAIGEAKTCQRIAEELKLKMRIVEAEHLFGGERIIFYFTSENRVDFRELVKRLAREYQTRIELRQIGSRDEAKLISDYETCGQQCCCSRFLKILEPVNMRMAKLQKATLDPSKISGHCGRLKCCLRYEDQTYLDLKKKMPHRNTDVRTPKGFGKVVDVQILTQLVVVQSESGDRQAWPLDEIEVLKPGQREKEEKSPEQQKPRREPARQPVSKVKEAAITEELEEIAETEQESLEAETPQKAQQAKNDGSQRQDGDPNKKKKRRRRRPRNKKRDSQNGSGENKPQNKQPSKNRNNQKNNQNKKQKPSNGNATPSSGE